MSELTPEKRAEWGKDAQRNTPTDMTTWYPANERILVLLDALEEAERRYAHTGCGKALRAERDHRVFAENAALTAQARAVKAEQERDLHKRRAEVHIERELSAKARVAALEAGIKALTNETGPTLSCAGFNIREDGCFVADLCHRLDALTEKGVDRG